MWIRPMLPQPITPTVLMTNVRGSRAAFTTFTGLAEAAIFPSPVKIYVGSDHAGVKLRNKLVERLRGQGHDAIDLGPQTDSSVGYPDWAARVARAVRGDAGTLGLLVCGSGIGVSMAANKVHGIRAA